MDIIRHGQAHSDMEIIRQTPTDADKHKQTIHTSRLANVQTATQSDKDTDTLKQIKQKHMQITRIHKLISKTITKRDDASNGHMLSNWSWHAQNRAGKSLDGTVSHQLAIRPTKMSWARHADSLRAPKMRFFKHPERTTTPGVASRCKNVISHYYPEQSVLAVLVQRI